MTSLEAAPETNAIVIVDGRRAIRVTGNDRRTFLDATLSQSMSDLESGRWRSALWLDIHAAPLAALDVVADPTSDAFVLLADTDGSVVVMEKLAMRTFLAEAAFAMSEDVVVAVRGEVPEGLVPDAGTAVRVDGVLVIGRDGGVDLVGPELRVASLVADLGLPAISQDVQALSDWEVRHGVPRTGHEIVAPHLPEEAGVLPTHVHLAKGCYPGQEAVARMWMLGRPRRRLVVLDVDGDVGPGAQAGEGRARVVVTRVTAQAPRQAMAFVPPTLAVGDHVEGDGWSATVRSIVGGSAAQPGADPAVTRRRDR